MNVIWETMIDEMRAQRAEYDNRRHFTAEKDPIVESRQLLRDWTEPREIENPEVIAARTGANLRRAADADLFEVG